jgi:hypothetical protein
MEPGRNSFPPFQDGGGGPRDEDNKKAAPMRAPPIPKEILIPSSLPDWIILYPDCQVENCNSYCCSVVAASGKQYGKTGDVAATRADLAPEKSNF